MRTCKACGVSKPVSGFYEVGGGKFRPQCKPCYALLYKKIADLPCATVEEYWRIYNSFLKKQNGLCAICKNPPTIKRRLALDHSHKTLEFRGLLCTSCNTKLSFVETYEQSINEYLKGSSRIR